MTPDTGKGSASRRRVRAVASGIAAFYKGCALLLCNAIVVYVLINLALAAVFGIRDRARAAGPTAGDPITAKYGAERLDAVYPGLDRQEREEMLAENWKRPYVYADYTHFKERPCDGRHVKVSEVGYRESVNQGPWPPVAENLNIFVFGGSTTFGYGLPDNQTVPSYLQEAVAKHARRRVCVYNFGVGWFYSTQERIRFEQLLMAGHVPHVALFVDGINDAHRHDNRPAFSAEMARVFEEVSGFNESQSPNKGSSPDWRRVKEVAFDRLPVGRAARSILQRAVPPEGVPAPNAEHARKKALARAVETYFTNKFLIEQACLRFRVTPTFVWQPAPGYHYDMDHHLFAVAEAVQDIPMFYSIMREFLDRQPAEPHFLWCADIQKDRAECLYCDHTHYTASFARVFAEHICQLCLERKLLDRQLAP